MICTTIQHRNADEILQLLANSVPALMMAEIRLDRCSLTIEDIETIFDSEIPLIATCRVAGDGTGTWKEAETKLAAAIKAGADFVDVEIEAPKEMGKRLRKLCNEYGATMIRSCHFFDGTPQTDILTGTLEKCRKYGGEISKIVATASCQEEIDRIMSLYDSDTSGNLIAFAMGEYGRESRLECLRKGAPYTYAAVSAEDAAAAGQWAYKDMFSAIYGSRKLFGYKSEEGPHALVMPASKSFSQRAIIAAALAGGESHIGGYSPCGDSEAALEVARTIGATVHVNGSELTIKGTGGKIRQHGDGGSDRIFVGESGLLTRLMIPVCAAIGSGEVRIEGHGTLLNRPLKGAASIMAPFGVLLIGNGQSEIKVPLTVKGSLLPGKAIISGKEGSQLISGLLMALPLLPANSTLRIHDPKSIPYMFITLDVLKKFGIRITSEMYGDDDFEQTHQWEHCTGITFRIEGNQHYKAGDFSIEGDWSAAANFLVAGAIFGKSVLRGLDFSSLQADISILDILSHAGAGVSGTEYDYEQELPGTIFTSQKAPTCAFDADLNNCPDLFPIVAILAALCNGNSNLSGYRRLASKESDRGTAILTTLHQMGVEACAEGDTMTITGESFESRLLSNHLLKGGDYTSFHDHRMAMALKVASLAADSPIRIDDTACIAKSFPDFMEMWHQAL